MLDNLLKTLSFGATINSNGKPYSVVMRLTDRMFIVIGSDQKLPAPLLIAQADIQMKQPGPGQSGPGIPGAGGAAGDTKAPMPAGSGSSKTEEDKPNAEKPEPKKNNTVH